MHHAIAMPAPAGLSALTDLERVLLGFLADYHGNTHATYQENLRRFIGWCETYRVDPLTAERTHIALYVRHLTDLGLRASTVSTYFVPVKGFYRWAFLENVIDRDPAVHVKLPRPDYRKKYPLDRDDLKALRRAGTKLGGRHWALTEMLVCEGMRIGECCGVQIENCQDVEGGHRVMRFRAKGGRWDTVPLPVTLAQAIDAAAGGRRAGPVLTTRDGRPMVRNTAVGLLRTVVRHSGLTRHVNPHLIRASSITFLVKGDGGIYEGQRLGRHEDPRTTSRHYDLSTSDHDTHPVHILSARLTAA